jgi:hypothetical protein
MREINLSKIGASQVVFTQQTHPIVTESKEAMLFVGQCLLRHRSGDWGDLCEEDKFTNDHALMNEGRLLSSYNVPKELIEDFDFEDKIWIITEWDFSLTTILFPGEY